jgi:hypothetical protein
LGKTAADQTLEPSITPLGQRSCPPLYFSSILQVGGIGQ